MGGIFDASKKVGCRIGQHVQGEDAGNNADVDNNLGGVQGTDGAPDTVVDVAASHQTRALENCALATSH